MSADLWGALGGLLVLILGAFGLYRKGRKDVKRETALEAAERIAKAHDKRRKIEDDIDQDDDLYGRAVRSGVVRPDNK